MRRRRQLPHVHGRDRGRAGAGALLLPLSDGGHGGHHQQRPRRGQPEDGARIAARRRCRRPAYTPTQSELEQWAKKIGRRRAAFRRAAISRQADLSHPAMAVQPGRLHPVHPLRARLPRRTGQRRHRVAFRGAAVEDRVRSRRPDGRLHVRGLRRMRAGVPHRRADARARGRRRRSRPEGRLRLPVLRRRLPDSPTTSRTTRFSTCRAATARPTASRLCVKGRFGFDYVQHRHRLTTPLIRKPGVAEAQSLQCRSRQLERRFRDATWDEALDFAANGLRDARDTHGEARWRVSARRRAPTKRPTCSRSSCAPASARTTSITARGSVMRRAWRR